MTIGDGTAGDKGVVEGIESCGTITIINGFWRSFPITLKGFSGGRWELFARGSAVARSKPLRE
jgi:hypothetical protein